MFDEKTIQECYNIFEAKLEEPVKLHVPLHKPKTKRPKPLWLTKEAAIAISDKRNKYQMFKRSRHYSHTRYAAATNDCNRQIKSAKQCYMRQD